MKESANHTNSTNTNKKMYSLCGEDKREGREMRKIFNAMLLVLGFALFGAGVAAAQDNALELVLNRNFGMALGKQIQGSFTLALGNTDNLVSVTYFIDGQPMSTVSEAPFRYSFSTDGYALGTHRLSAQGKTRGGQTLDSNVIEVEMVSAAEGFQSAGRVLLPIGGLLVVVIGVMLALQLLPMSRNKRRFSEGGVRNYGVAGGAICPRCGRPFARSFFGLNLLTGKLERCPYCGKWSITRPASLEALRAAEQAEVAGAAPAVREVSAEERLRQQIEDSKLSR
jgi:DNA-directed RNA polymerase subunit RPC12/RpoP